VPRWGAGPDSHHNSAPKVFMPLCRRALSMPPDGIRQPQELGSSRGHSESRQCGGVDTGGIFNFIWMPSNDLDARWTKPDQSVSGLLHEARRMPSAVEARGTRRDVNRVFLKHGKGHDLECPLVSGCEHHKSRGAVVVCPQPVRRRHAPAVPRD